MIWIGLCARQWGTKIYLSYRPGEWFLMLDKWKGCCLVIFVYIYLKIVNAQVKVMKTYSLTHSLTHSCTHTHTHTHQSPYLTPSCFIKSCSVFFRIIIFIVPFKVKTTKAHNKRLPMHSGQQKVM